MAFPHAVIQLNREDVWNWFVAGPVQILVTVLFAVVTRWLLHRVIDRIVTTSTSRHEKRVADLPARAGRILAKATGMEHERYVQRTRTMGAILRSIVTFTIVTITVLTVMALLGIPLAPLLASAGVGGVALGFGAQSLVKDFLSGIFMIMEDQYGVGDVIDTGEAVGTVEDVTLRVTKLRDFNGVAWYIRNGQVVRIGNKSQGWSTAMVDIPIAMDESIERALPIIRAVVAEIDDEPEWSAKLLEEPQVLGVESMTAGTVTIRVLAKCASNQNFSVQREIRERVKTAFDQQGIRGPNPYGPIGQGGMP